MLRLTVNNVEYIYFLKDGQVIGEVFLSDLEYGCSMVCDFDREPNEYGVTILRGKVLLNKREGPALIAEFRRKMEERRRQ